MLAKKTILATSKYVLLILLITGLISCRPAGSSFGIVFSSNINGDQDIYRTFSPDFKSMERLTFTPLDTEQALKVTRNGKKIVFYVAESPSESNTSSAVTPAHTFLLDTATQSTTVLDGGFSDLIPNTWSPDENQIILSQPSSHKAFIMGADGTDVNAFNIRLTNENSLVGSIRFSPDGKRITYEEINKYGPPPLPLYTSFLYDLQTQVVTPLGDMAANCNDAKWSSTEEKILLVCNLSSESTDTNYHVQILEIIGTDVVTIESIADFSQCLRPAWSPTGKQIAMMCINDGHQGLFVANSDGSGLKALKISTPIDPNHIWEINWSPDGKQIIYVAGENKGSSNVYITNIDGSNNNAVTTQPADYSELTIYSLEP